MNFKKCLSVSLMIMAGITQVFAASPQFRIVTIGSGITETLYALNAQSDLVGVDTSSTWPPEAKKLPQVGYQRTLTAEGILALKPTLLIGTEDKTGPEATLKQLTDAGVQVVLMPSTPQLTTVKERLLSLGTLIGKGKEGEALWAKVEADLEQARKLQKNVSTEKRVLFLLSVPGRAPLAAGKETEADLVLESANAENVVTEFSGYRVLSPEAIQALNPDVIIFTEDGMPSADLLNQLREQPGIKHTKAGENNAIIGADTNLLLSLGPRFGEAVLLVTKELL